MYVVTAHKSTNVPISVTGHYTSPTDCNLILSRSTRLEVHSLTKDGLQAVADVPIYGRISSLKLFRPKGEKKDLLFMLTERYKFCVLEYDASTGELITRANGDVADKTGRPTDIGQLAIIEPFDRMIGLHLYDGLFKVIPIDERGNLLEAFNIRLEELKVIDLTFLHGVSKPTLAVLYEDKNQARHVRTYEVLVKDKDFADGPWSRSNLDPGANLLIPIPSPVGGAVVLGESVIVYLGPNGQMKSTAIRPTVIRAYGAVDENGSRFLLGDHAGNLMLLLLQGDGTSVSSLKLERLGRTSQAATISYLDSGVVFVGSSFGDSQLIRLHSTPIDADQPGEFVEVVESMTNLGPIVDFCVVDLDRQGQGQVVTCSGAGVDGSLRIVRNGIGVLEQASVDLVGVKGVWSLRASYTDAHDTYLVLTFIGETRVLEINAADELDEAEISGFDGNAQTLYCGNVQHDQIVQVTSTSVRLIGGAGGAAQVAEWKPPPGLQVNVAAGSPSQVVVATGEGHIVYLEVGQGSLQEQGLLKLDVEVSCLDISPVGADPERSSLVAVGTWGMDVLLYAVPGLTLLTKHALGGEVIPRSVLFALFEGVRYLLCALGDGHLVNFHLDPSTGALTDRKNISLGTKPTTLRSFRSNGATNVFAASDRPTVIYSANKKLLYSNLNENEVNFITSFNSLAFPDNLAIAKENSLTIGAIDEIQKLHIRAVPLHEQPRRIAHQESTRTFGVCTTHALIGSSDPSSNTDFVRLLDDQTFETLDRHQLGTYELACSIASLTFADDANVYFVVGTAYAIPEEADPTKGRVLVFQVRDGKLDLVAERVIAGAAYNVTAFHGRVLVGINHRLQLYRWAQRDDGSRELVSECGHAGHVMALYVEARGDFILVGDIMKSMQVLIYKPDTNTIETRARDYRSNWMSAVTMLDDDTYLGAENSYNMFVVRKNSDAATDEERSRLEVVGEFGLGEFVNRFQHGSLVMKLPDSDISKIPTLLFGSINGTIGVIASLPKEQFLFLEKLQDALRKVVKGVGGLDHAQWREFASERGKFPSRGFVDGDLVETFLDLKRDKMETVVAEAGGASVDDVIKMLEELSRLH